MRRCERFVTHGGAIGQIAVATERRRISQQRTGERLGVVYQDSGILEPQPHVSADEDAAVAQIGVVEAQRRKADAS